MCTIWPDSLTQAKGPKYRVVADTIRAAISSGQLEEGAKLPPVRELAYQLGITPGTVARAYTVLTDDGSLRAEVGRGTFVAPTHPDPGDPEGTPIEIDVIAHDTHFDPEGEVNLFSPHLPNVGQARLLRTLLQEIGKKPPSGLMHYPSQKAARPAREAIANWLQGLPIGAVDPEQIVLANGGQNAISLLFQTLLRGRRPAILVEELSYPGFRRSAELLRADVIPVAMDEHGIIPEALDTAARSHESQILCTTPDVHNPTGLFTPAKRREEITEIARKHDFAILEDGCYLVRNSRAPSYRMLAPERSWFVTSLSKSLTPALRFGFAVGPQGQAARMRRTAEYGFFGVSPILTDLCTALLTHPQTPLIEQEVRRINNVYLQSAVNILGMYQLGWHPETPFIWLVLPEGWRAGSFCMAAESLGVRVRPAEDYACRNARSPHAVRMAVNAGLPLDRFEAAMQTLRDLLDNPSGQINV
jgi:DNA-binding transcriptional MocR family regulator